MRREVRNAHPRQDQESCLIGDPAQVGLARLDRPSRTPGPAYPGQRPGRAKDTRGLSPTARTTSDTRYIDTAPWPRASSTDAAQAHTSAPAGWVTIPPLRPPESRRRPDHFPDAQWITTRAPLKGQAFRIARSASASGSFQHPVRALAIEGNGVCELPIEGPSSLRHRRRR
jgi:hypothetical protein